MTTTTRYFVTYSGVRLPLKLVDQLEESQVGNRNTYMRATYDALGRMIVCEKLVYGAVELSHRYAYHGDGPTLARAEVTALDGDPQVVTFGPDGRAVVALDAE